MSTNGQDGTYVNDLNIAEWRTALREARARLESEAKELAERNNAVYAEINRITAEEELIEQVSRAYAARLRSTEGRPSLPGNNLKEVIILNFADARGVIIGKEVVDRLMDIGYYSNRRTAYGAVYTALGKPPFIKHSPGVYAIPADSPDWIRLRTKVLDGNGNQIGFHFVKESGSSKPPLARSTGLTAKVKSILADSPDWTRRDVADFLVATGWDFQGKKPIFAVSSAFRGVASHKPRAA